jgi:hypothetical protein
MVPVSDKTLFVYWSHVAVVIATWAWWVLTADVERYSRTNQNHVTPDVTPAMIPLLKTLAMTPAIEELLTQVIND